MRDAAEHRMVMVLVADGHSDVDIAKRTGVPRRTVSDWRRGRRVVGLVPEEVVASTAIAALPHREYAYLLGLYLGDGCLSPAARDVWRLRLVLDAKYPGIIQSAAEAMERVRPGRLAHVMTRRDAECVQVSMYWKLWPVVFPQHGPGVKHARAIRLAAWQEAIVERERHAFLQGLIHSDGWRCVAQERTRRAVRYGFSNLSEDIKDLFCASCDAIGVRWTRTDRQVTVARAASVAILEEIVGPKS